jgi:DNA-binding MarR family transcriptional regulator
MDPLFDTSPIRSRTPRRERAVAILGRRWYEPWPPIDRDTNDVAVAASRLLATAGRLQTRLRRIARRHGVDPRFLRFLLLFAETKSPLRVIDVADNLGVSDSTASRIVGRALDAGLVDRINGPVDGREVAVRLAVAGRDATLRCLDAIRADAAAIARQPAAPRHGFSGAFGIRWYLRNAGPMDEGWTIYRPE